MGDFFTWGPVVTDSSYYRETRLASTPVADVTVHQPLEMLRQLKKLHIPVILGNNADEGTMFVFSAFPARMAKVVFQAYILSFFRASAPGVLRLYTKLIKKVDDSPYPDYRIPLSTIIGDYLFRCPNKLFASLLAQTPISTPVFLYEFALPTRVQGFPSCDGLSCHTVEIPYVFNLVDMVVQENIWKPSEIDVGSALSDSLGDDDVDVDLSSTEAYHRRPSHIESSTVESRGGKVDSNSRSDQRYNPQHNPSGSANQTTNDSRYISPDTYEKEEEWARYNMAKKGTQNFNLFSMPDIFGATQALFQKRRMQSPVITANIDDDSLIGIHIQVSDHMAHFWTTFARFGDPNGQRSADNNNGYVNRDDTSEPSPPFWPSVLGALPYIPPDTYYVSDEDVSDSSSSGNSELDGNYKWKPRRDRQFQQMLQHWNSTRRDRQSTSNTQSRPISTRISSRKDDTKDNIERAQNIKSNDDHIVSVAKQSSGAEDSNTFQPPFKKFLGLFPKLFVEYPDEDDDESSESDENSISISTGDRHSKNADTQSRTSPSSSEWIGFRNGGVQIDLRRLFHRHDDDEGQGDQEGEEPTSNTDSTEGSESVTQTGRDGIAKIKAIGEQSVPEAVDITFEGSSHETHPQMHRDIPVRGSNTPSSMKLALPRSNNRVVSIPAGLEVSGEEVHVMVFDEATGSSIIGEDCVCKFWNHLQYRF